MYKLSLYNYFVNYQDRVIYFNGLTKAFFSVSINEDKFIKGQMNDLVSFEIFYKDFFSFLEKQGFIVDDKVDEVDILRFRNRQEVFLNKSYSLIIYPTIDCNFSCWYCFQKHPHLSMTDEVMDKVKRHIVHSVEKNVITALDLCWFGGEPLLEFDRVIYPLSFYFQEILGDKGIPYHQFAVTNGYLINPNMVKKMKEINLCGFQITLDGAERKHNLVRNVKGKPSFSRIIDNINLVCGELENASIRLRINFDNQTLKDQTLKDVFENIPKEFRHKITPDFQRVWQTIKNEKMEENSDLLDYYRFCSSLGYTTMLPTARFFIDSNIRCYADRFYHSVINYDGRIYKCTAKDYTEDNSVGELNSEGQIVWNTQKIAQMYAKATFENEKCINCKYLPLCLGPCVRNMLDKDLSACALNNAEVSPENFIIGVYKKSHQTYLTERFV